MAYTKYQLKSLTLSFNSVDLGAVQAPSAQPQSSDPTDVTCLDDVAKQFIAGALLNNDQFDVTVQGLAAAPTINTVGSLVLTPTYTDGTNDSGTAVTITNCILVKVDPPNPEAGGDRAANWVLTFQPGGLKPSAVGGQT